MADLINEIDIPLNKMKEIESVLNYISSCQVQMYTNIMQSDYSIKNECFKNVLFVLNENDFDTFTDTEINLDNGFYYLYNLFYEYYYVFYTINNNSDIFDYCVDNASEIEYNKKDIILKLSNRYSKILGKILGKILEIVIEMVEELKLDQENLEKIIEISIESILNITLKYRIILDSSIKKGYLNFWKSNKKGLFGLIDKSISINFNYNFD